MNVRDTGRQSKLEILRETHSLYTMTSDEMLCNGFHVNLKGKANLYTIINKNINTF